MGAINKALAWYHSLPVATRTTLSLLAGGLLGALKYAWDKQAQSAALHQNTGIDLHQFIADVGASMLTFYIAHRADFGPKTPVVIGPTSTSNPSGADATANK